MTVGASQRFFSSRPEGLRVRVRLSPRAKATRAMDVAVDAQGEAVLRAAVTAAPEGGKANAALIKLLAEEWHLPRSTITVTQGVTNRDKTLMIAGVAEDLSARLEAWMEERGS